MKRNEAKQVISVIVAAAFVLIAAGCASVPSAEAQADDIHVDFLADRGTGTN